MTRIQSSGHLARRALAGLGALALAWGCGPATPPADQPQQPANPPSAGDPPPPEKAPEPPAQRLGFDKEHPVLRCGPGDSYQYVANHRCSDGSKPLQGDPRAGRSARVGNVGQNSKKHIIDHYLVPCPDGDAQIFVDMYGCPEWAARLGGP